MRPLRKVFVVGFLAAAVPVAGASLASACTALATISFSAASAAPGATVTGTGKGFNGGGHGVDNVRTPVVFHWQTRNGPILTTATPPDATGVISYSFTVPTTSAVGQYVVIAVQNDPATNVPYYGTPARQALAVAAVGRVASSTSAEAAPAPAAAAAAPTESAAVAPVATATPAAAVATPSVAAAQTASAAAPAASAPVSARGAVASPNVATSNAATAAPEAGLSATNGSSSAVTASAIAPIMETTTPGLLPIATDSGRSVTPALLLLVVGMLLALAAAARWLTTRVPGLRHAATA